MWEYRDSLCTFPFNPPFVYISKKDLTMPTYFIGCISPIIANFQGG